MKQKLMSEIRKAFRVENYRYTQHATDQSIDRKIKEAEVKEAITNGEIIEEYPEDKYCPSCLIYGKTSKGRALHIQCSLPPKISIVTVYQPDPEKWINNKVRRKGVK